MSGEASEVLINTRGGALRKRFPLLQRKRGVALVLALVAIPLLGLLGLLALRNRHGSASSDNGAQGMQGDVVTNDTFFYGQSEPVYPSRKHSFPLIVFLSLTTLHLFQDWKYMNWAKSIS